MKYKLVIFDFDGTLADSLPWFLRNVNTLADKFKFKHLDPCEVEQLKAFDAKKAMQHLQVPLWKLPVIGNELKQMMARDIHQIPLFTGVNRLLRALSEHGVAMAIVTSNAYENVCQVLGPENIALIQHYACGTTMFGKHIKLKKILKQSKVLPSEALCIGDEIRDLEAARQTNIPYAGVAWGYTTAAALLACSPLRVFTNMDEIIQTLV